MPRLPSAPDTGLQQRNGVFRNRNSQLQQATAAQTGGRTTFPFRLSGLAGSLGLTNVTFAAGNLATP